jgi:Tfp pilus assembly protein FimT
MAAIAMPRYGRSIARYRVNLAAQRVIADLDYARNRARQTSYTITVNVQTGSNTIVIPNISGLRVAGESYMTAYADDPYRVTLANSDFGGNETVLFNGYGIPNSGGSVDVQAGSLSITVTLDPVTGKASIP